MQSDEFYMKEVINFAKAKNPCWPFAAMIVDEDTGEILVKATDVKHISPAFAAESFAIHQLALNYNYMQFKSLKMYCTAEPELLTSSAIISARTTGYNINKIVYAVPQKKICDFWSFPYLDNSQVLKKLQVKEKVLEENAWQVFEEAKLLQAQINDPHPGKAYLSRNFSSFYEVKQELSIAQKYTDFQNDFGNSVDKCYDSVIESLFAPNFTKVANGTILAANRDALKGQLELVRAQVSEWTMHVKKVMKDEGNFDYFIHYDLTTPSNVFSVMAILGSSDGKVIDYIDELYYIAK